VQVRSELSAARQELAAAQLTIQEREYAVATQQRCEAALAAHAGALHAALAGAAADIGLLFQRWDEKNELEDGNLALVQVGVMLESLRGLCGQCACGAAVLVPIRPLLYPHRAYQDLPAC
jgi:hypothetical protein